jgi:hypothetical protein
VAETTANNIIRAIALSELNLLSTTASMTLNAPSTAILLMHYGGEDLIFNSDGVNFKFSVSERSWDALYVYPNTRDDLFLIPTIPTGQPVQLESLSSAKRALSLEKGQMACFRNSSGFTLIFRLLSANLPKPNEVFQVSFAFAIFAPNHPVIAP